MGRSGFVHLHVHTEYSRLDSTITVSDLVKQAKAFNLPAVAITDHGNIDGAEDLIQQCRGTGIKPIIGCEMYVVDDLNKVGPMTQSFHLVLLSTNGQGYRNLRQLVAFAQTKGFHYKPLIDKRILRDHASGLIALSGCIHGEIPYLCFLNRHEEAADAARCFDAIFPGRFYLELHANGLPEQRTVNRHLLDLAEILNLPVVASNDCHYLHREDAYDHEKLLCRQTGKSIHDPSHLRFSANEFYFKSLGEMAAAFADVPEAIRNAGIIADNVI